MTKAVLLDLDDTLYPEAQFVIGGYRAVAEVVRSELGVDPYYGFVALFKRGIRQRVFERVLRRYAPSVTEPYLRRLVQVYRNHIPKLALFPEVADFLRMVHKHAVIGLVTDGCADVQRRKVRALSLERLVDAVIFSDELGREFWKPHARPFEECLRKLHQDSASAVYVGDNPQKDFDAPLRLGMRAVRVRRPGTLHFAVPGYGSVEGVPQVRNLMDVVPLLGW